MKIRESHVTLAPPFTFLLVFFILPLIIIFVISLGERSATSLVNLRLNIDNYLRILDPLYLKVLWRSIWYALTATVLCLALGFPIAYYMTFSPPRQKLILMFLILVPFWTNFLVRIFAWLTILGRQGIVNDLLIWSGVIHEPLQLLHTPGAVIVGLVYGELPFMVLPLVAALDRMDPALLEAATDLGANRWQAFRRVAVPLSIPGIIAGCIFVFVPSLGSFVVPDILGGSDSFMIGNTIKNQFMTVRDWPFGSAISMLLLLVVTLGVSSYLRNSRDKMSIGEYL